MDVEHLKAIDAAAKLGDRATLIELGATAWAEARWEHVAAALRALGLEASQDAVVGLSEALSSVNGRRRKNLLTPKEVVTCLVEARHGDAPSSRRPVHGRLIWMARRVERPFCEAIRGDDGHIQLVVGEEGVASYQAVPDRLSVALTEGFAPMEVVEPSEQATSVLPVEVAQRLERIHVGEPNSYTFDALLELLAEQEGEPFYEAAIELAEAQLVSWEAAERAPHYAWARKSVGRPHGRLIQAVRLSLDDLHVCLEACPDRAPITTLTHFDLASFTLPEGASEESLGMLQRLTGLEHLRMSYWSVSEEEMALLARLRFPASLRTVTLPNLPNPDHLSALLEHLSEDCPELERVHFTAHNSPHLLDRLEGLRGLSEGVALGVTVTHPSAYPEVAQAIEERLGARRLDVLDATDISDTRRLYTAVGVCDFVAGVGALRLTTRPGGLAALFAEPERWSRLSRLAVKVASLTSEDLTALTRLPTLASFTELEVTGELGTDAARQVAAALASDAPRLERLALPGSRLGNEGLRAFADAGLLRGLRHLNLHDGRFKGRGLVVLTDPDQGPAQLETLVLSKNSMGKPVVTKFAEWEPLGRLRLLDLTKVRLSPDNRERLFASPWVVPEAVRGQPA